MRENDVVAVGEQGDSADVEFIAEGIVGSVWVGAPEVGGFLWGEVRAVAFEFEVEG